MVPIRIAIIEQKISDGKVVEKMEREIKYSVGRNAN